MPSHRRPGHTIVALHGDLDLAAAPALREHLHGVLTHSHRRLTLDLSKVSFCDAAGLAVLTGTQRHATWLGITVHLSAPNPQVAKLLHITGLDRSFTVHPGPPPTPGAWTRTRGSSDAQRPPVVVMAEVDPRGAGLGVSAGSPGGRGRGARSAA